MRLCELRTIGLFGLVDHLIPLNLDDRITIIHGPNGYGKTAILRIITGVLNARFSVLSQFPFTSLSFVFDNGSVLEVKKAPRKNQAADGKKRPSESIVLAYGDKHVDLSRLGTVHSRNFPLSIFEDYIPHLSRYGPEEWFYHPTNEVLSLDDLLFRFGESLPFETGTVLPDWLAALTSQIHVHYIQAHRLEGLDRRKGTARADRERPKAVAAVSLYAAELASQIKAALATYADVSQSKDRSFPARLVNVTTAPNLTVADLTEKLAQLEKRRAQLTSAGLLDKEEHVQFPVPSTINEPQRGVLSVYVSDAEEKLAVFDDLYERINLFSSIINRRFKYKSMQINKQDGIVFVSKKDGRILPATSLSTGEQHEVVLLYELLFHVQKDALILIDEPEISLHIAWQEQFLKDLEQITALSSFDVLIATHSPQIISDRWDLTVELKGPAE